MTADEALLADALAHIDATRHLYATLPAERRAAHLEPQARAIVARLRERLRDCGCVEDVGDAPDMVRHRSGLRVQAVTGPNARTTEAHTLPLPQCCPVSGNPQPGSTITLRYRPAGWCLEVYALQAIVRRFVGGFPGTGGYLAERNMEGMIRLLAQMSADALGVPIRASASLKLDAGDMALSARATPEP